MRRALLGAVALTLALRRQRHAPTTSRSTPQPTRRPATGACAACVARSRSRRARTRSTFRQAATSVNSALNVSGGQRGLVIAGAGADVTTVRGNGNDRVLTLGANGLLGLQGMTFAHGRAQGTDNFGGLISVSSAVLVLEPHAVDRRPGAARRGDRLQRRPGVDQPLADRRQHRRLRWELVQRRRRHLAVRWRSAADDHLDGLQQHGTGRRRRHRGLRQRTARSRSRGSRSPATHRLGTAAGDSPLTTRHPRPRSRAPCSPTTSASQPDRRAPALQLRSRRSPISAAISRPAPTAASPRASRTQRTEWWQPRSPRTAAKFRCLRSAPTARRATRAASARAPTSETPRGRTAPLATRARTSSSRRRSSKPPRRPLPPRRRG